MKRVTALVMMVMMVLTSGAVFAADESAAKHESTGKEKQMIIEIDVRTGKQVVKDEEGNLAEAMPLSNLILEENVDGKIVRHKVFAISEGAIIRTNPCTWVVIGGVLKRICW